MLHQIECKQCHNIFIGRDNARFCSIPCVRAYYRSEEGKKEKQQQVDKCLANQGKERKKPIKVICKACKTEFETIDYERKFCSVTCSSHYVGSTSMKGKHHSKESKQKISDGVYKYVGNSKRIPAELLKPCRICGSIKGTCKQLLICQWLNNGGLKILRHFNFDESTVGSQDVYKEVYRIRDLLFTKYVIQKQSMCQIVKDYGVSSASALLNCFNLFGIERRSIKESLHNAVLSGRLVYVPPKNLGHPSKGNPYHQGWYTTWDGFKVYYRSSYELSYCKYLDSKKVHYVMEEPTIPYFNSVTKKMSVAFPDFYIPSTNTLVEIKSEFTYSRINMIDRFRSYHSHGYNYKLVLEGTDYGMRLPKTNNAFYDYLKAYSSELIPLYKSCDV